MKNPFVISRTVAFRPDWPLASLVGASFLAGVVSASDPQDGRVPADEPAFRSAPVEMVTHRIGSSSTAADGVVDGLLGSSGDVNIRPNTAQLSLKSYPPTISIGS